MSESSESRARLIVNHLVYAGLHLGLTASTVVDWLVSAVLYSLSKSLYAVQPFQQDPAQYIHDPAYQFPRRDPQTVPYELLTNLTFWMPLGFIAAVGCARQSLIEVHIGLLSFFAGYCINWVLTDFIKVLVGELRPDFFDRCKYDELSQACTGDFALVDEGRRSFPSGHSSNAFYSAIFLILFIAGKNKAFMFKARNASANPVDSRVLRFMIAISPIFLALYIALSRWEDHIHHPIDILAGSVLGTVIGLITYHFCFPQPFTDDTGGSSAAKPRATEKLEQRVRDYRQSMASSTPDERRPLLLPS